MLSSGSGGNSTLVRSGGTSVLLDTGISCRDLARRLSLIGADLDSIDAAVLSHEHNDHVRGAASLARRSGARFYANRATCRGANLTRQLPSGTLLEFSTGAPFEVGELEITAFPLPHDASDTVGFRVTDGQVRAAFATDLGSLTMDVVQGLSDCNVVVLESNHDETMLIEGPYSATLKRRVKGPKGHLSNADAAELIRCIMHGGLKHIVLAHMSRTNNTPELGLESAREALGRKFSHVEVSLGWQNRPGEFIKIG